MSYDIIIRFPSKEMAEEFCAQMSDGFGEGFCRFDHFQQKPGTDGKSQTDYEQITDSVKDAPVYFVKWLEYFEEEASSE